MELPPTNELPNPDRQPHHADGGLQSPFEVAGSRTTPFAGDPGPQQPQSQPPGGPPSPFEIASDPAPPAPAAAPPAWEQQPAAQPQFQPPAPQTPASPFESEAPAPIPSGPIPTPVETAGPMPGAAPLQHTPVEEDESVHLPPGALEDSREFVEMNVMQLLGGVAPAELGLAELAVSPFAKTRVPMAMLRPQLPTGQVFLNVSDVIVGCKPEHRAELVGCNPTVRLRVPLALIFPMAGEMPAVPAAPPAPAAVAPAPDPFAGSPQTTLPPTDPTPSPFSNGEALPAAGALAATPNAGVLGGFPVLGSAASAPPAEGTPAIAPQGFPPAAGAVNLEPPQAEVPPPAANVGSSFGSPLAALAPLGGGVEPASPAPAPISDEDQASPLPPLMPAGGGLAPTSFEMPAEAPRQPEPPAAPRDEPAPPAASEAGGWPFDESQNGAPPAVEEVVESLEDLMPVNAEGDFTSAAGFESAPAASGPQSALQGLFLKDGAIDAASVVQHCTELPGIDTCAVIGRDGNTSANSGDFSCDAASVFSSLQQLTGALGVSGDEPITVRAGDGMVSYFSGAGLAIGVKHDSRGFRPGVRERLMLIARELGKLAG